MKNNEYIKLCITYSSKKDVRKIHWIKINRKINNVSFGSDSVIFFFVTTVLCSQKKTYNFIFRYNLCLHTLLSTLSPFISLFWQSGLRIRLQQLRLLGRYRFDLTRHSGLKDLVLQHLQLRFNSLAQELICAAGAAIKFRKKECLPKDLYSISPLLSSSISPSFI